MITFIEVIAYSIGASVLALIVAWLSVKQLGFNIEGFSYPGCAAIQSFVNCLVLLSAVWVIGLTGFAIHIIVVVAVLLVAIAWSVKNVIELLQKKQKARRGYETAIINLMLSGAVVAILVTIGIVATVITEAWQFFSIIPITEFLFGLEWSPQIAIREDQAGASGSFGVIPVLLGTILVSFIAMCVSIPLGLLSAIYLAEFASSKIRNNAKPALEFLAGIPTVVYGFFALITLSPWLRDLGANVGLHTSGESALAAGLVIGVMTIPFVASLSEDAIVAVPDDLRNGSLALGSTHGEVVVRVVLPAALPGIVAGLLLALSRAIGETMIVVMAAGLSANLTVNPLESVTTITVQIVTLLTGDQTFDDPKTLAAFALGLLLFVFTLVLNLLALNMVRRYQERYE